MFTPRAHQNKFADMFGTKKTRIKLRRLRDGQDPILCPRSSAPLSWQKSVSFCSVDYFRASMG